MNGDREQMGWCEALYEAQVAGLILYGRALGLSHWEAEDVVQEVFRALLALAHPPQQPENYLVRAFRNRVLNYRRTLFRRVLREFESQRWFETHPDETDTERQAMSRLAQLPAEQREVIVLKIWHQRTFEEIGELLAISPNTAAGRYRYGLQKLRSGWGEHNEEKAYERESSLGTALGILDPAPALHRT